MEIKNNVLTAPTAKLAQANPAKKSPGTSNDGDFTAQLLGASNQVQAQAQPLVQTPAPQGGAELTEKALMAQPANGAPTQGIDPAAAKATLLAMIEGSRGQAGPNATLTDAGSAVSVATGQIGSSKETASKELSKEMKEDALRQVNPEVLRTLDRQMAQVAQTAARSDGSAETLSLPAIRQRSAGSLNAAVDFAGLQPWSKDWVFEGNLNRGPSAKTLLGGAQNPTALMRGESTIPAEIAQGANGTPDAQTLQAIAAMQGMLAEAGAQGAQPQERAVAPKAQLLSGGEYLGALQALRAGAQTAQAQQAAMAGQNGQQGNPERGAGSKLQLIEGGASPAKGKRSALEGLTLDAAPWGTHAMVGGPAHGTNPSLKTVDLSGQVVQGTMARDRLSTDAMFGLSGAVRDLSKGGGGEIRLRLNPNNLGEITMRVSTNGHQVGLQIQASDVKAKQVLEESLASLKESLANHQLTLGAVDLTVAQTQGGSGSPEFSQSNSSQSQLQDWNLQQGFHQNQPQHQDGGSRWAGGGSPEERDYRPQSSSNAASPMATAMGRARQSSGEAAGRLDVLA